MNACTQANLFEVFFGGVARFFFFFFCRLGGGSLSLLLFFLWLAFPPWTAFFVLPAFSSASDSSRNSLRVITPCVHFCTLFHFITGV